MQASRLPVKACAIERHAIDFYPRDAMLARVFATATCLSVRLSVTRRYCASERKQDREMYTI